jgi:hypothetical protein
MVRLHPLAPALLLGLLLATHCVAQPAPSVPQGDWTPISAGMEIASFKTNHPTPVGDSTIVILRIEPAQWELVFLCISETGDENGLTAKQWCRKHDLVAATNAGMFDIDYRTHVGYLKNDSHVNNSTVNQYRSAVAASPSVAGSEPIRIFDLDTDPIETIISRYGRVAQNLRLIKRPGINRWSQQEKMWSEAALGQDASGRLLLIFCRSPYSMHDLNQILLSLPIDLVCAQHLEGGPEAQLYVRSGDVEYEFAGSYETGFNSSDRNTHAWPIPNALGIRKR